MLAGGLALSTPSQAHGIDPSALAAAARSVVAVVPEWPATEAVPGEVEGSGVAVFDGTTIVTAYHVVAKALSVQVRSADGIVMDARVAALDEATDLAVLAIDEELPALEFGGDASIGEGACAVGHPFGFGLSVTCGVVSAVHKAGAGFNAIEDFVQTDASVNPGMSGGALVGADGRMLGILTSIFTRGADGSLGVNFAVASPLARRVAEDLVAGGRVARVATGMRLVPAIGRGETGRLAARVVAVRTGSPAAGAGLAVDDVIVRAGGRPIRKPADFVSVIARLGPGESLDLTVERGDESRIATITIPGP